MTDSKEPWEIWNDVLARVAERGLDGVDDRERTIFLVNRLLCDFENGGYSGFLYNISPPTSSEWTELRATAAAVSELGDDVTARLLQETALMFEATDDGSHSTWDDYLALADPNDTVALAHTAISDRVGLLWERLELFT